jgi:DNA-binding NtrC family response regulator
VGDDLHIGQAVRSWPKHHGFRVSTADGGTSGLAALDNATLDLMIADVFTPSMRGFEAIRLFHERAPTMPLVAISGYAFADMEISAPEFLRLATRPGATRCLRKPFKPATSPDATADASLEVRRFGGEAALMRSHAPSCAVLRRRRKATQFEE